MIIMPITPELDLEKIIKPNWEFSKFDLDLIGENLKPGWEHNKTPLQMARLIAQIQGANFQEDVAQAVVGDAEEIKKAMDEMNKYYPHPYELFRWVVYRIAHGDPKCANFHNWATLTVIGNMDAFIKVAPILREIIEKDKSVNMLHPELQAILETPNQIHYSARRIPKVTYVQEKNQLEIEWPKKDLRRTVGKPPTKIKL